MANRREHEFAEVLVDKLFLESLANDRSAYHTSAEERSRSQSFDRFRSRLRWHVNHSLSPRQKQVITMYLAGKKEREIATDLGITQQVVNIYKHRAIRRLHGVIAS